jgi:hypothetical protein
MPIAWVSSATRTWPDAALGQLFQALSLSAEPARYDLQPSADIGTMAPRAGSAHETTCRLLGRIHQLWNAADPAKGSEWKDTQPRPPMANRRPTSPSTHRVDEAPHGATSATKRRRQSAGHPVARLATAELIGEDD